jgi:mannose-6-phosphate isomerase
VLRGGLTPKHVDVPELLRVLNFNPTTESELRVDTQSDGLASFYDTPTAEFAASMLTLGAEWVGHEVDAPSRPGAPQGPQILLCIDGATAVHGKSGALTLNRGAAAWVAADDGPIRLVAQQPTKIFRVTVGI